MRHGHAMQLTDDVRVVRSHDQKRRAYRWLLLVGNTPEHVLDRRGRNWLQGQLGLARASRERGYLVIGFLGEPSRIVVLPAQKVLRDGRLCLDKGGIAWDD